MPFDLQSIDINTQVLGSRKSLLASSHRVRGSLYAHGIKRIIDVILALLSSVVFLPIVLFLALLIARDGHSPFYSQLRVGRSGRNFRMFKLRTMVPNADDLLAKHLKENSAARLEWETTQKLKNDPRITRIGRILRKTSVDELPQVINVLLGHMSLVGPRPMMASQKELYTGKAYFELRPGLTGLWQISDRNQCAFIDRVNFDETYHQSMSFSTDMMIMLRTVNVVLRGTGY